MHDWLTELLSRPVDLNLGSNVVSALFAAAAALLGAWMVRSLGLMQQARVAGTSTLGYAPGYPGTSYPGGTVGP